MAKGCVICGKGSTKLTTNPSYPDKPICLHCLNGFLVNVVTVEEELSPLSDALDQAAKALQKVLDK